MRRVIALLELFLLFLVIPLLHWRGWMTIPLLVVLISAAAFAAVWLWHAPSPPTFWSGPDRATERRHLRKLLRRFSLSVALMVAAVGLLSPEDLFAPPWQAPAAWLAIVVSYPVLSVYPQELVCRAYFFLRYRQLFPGRWMVVASAISFAAIHLVYANVPAILLSAVGGWFFADTYARSASLRLVWLEHTLYGLAVFTVGLGPFFSHPRFGF